MNLLKKLALAATVAVFSFSASAADLIENIGVVDETQEVVKFEHVVDDSFTDILIFELDVASVADSKVSINDFSIGGVAFVDAVITSWDMFESGSISALSYVLDGSTRLYGGLDSGHYYATFTGSSTGAIGGSYTVDLHTAPVPEPSTYALMLAGLGLVGFMARRRKAA